MQIFIVEDDENIREIESYALKKEGYEIREFADGEGLIEACLEGEPCLILLDIMLPGKDGYTLLKALKENEKTKEIPVLMVSAKSTEIDKVKGLDLGADDYIAKPFGTMELVSRVRALLRRTSKAEEISEYKCGEIVLNIKKRAVFVGENQVELTFKEFEVLKYFLSNVSCVVTRDKLLEAVWGFDFAGESRTVDMHIKTLRHKLGDAGAHIKTIRNVGYVLEN